MEKQQKIGTDPINILEWLRTECERGDFEMYSPAKGDLGRYTNLVTQIRKKDNTIGSSDVLIIAQSMVDKKCSAFLTFDSVLIQSRGLKEVIKEHVKDRRRYVISEEYSD